MNSRKRGERYRGRIEKEKRKENEDEDEDEEEEKVGEKRVSNCGPCLFVCNVKMLFNYKYYIIL